MKKRNYIGIIAIYGIIFALIVTLALTIFKPWNYEDNQLKTIFWVSFAFLSVSLFANVGSLFAMRRKDGISAVFFGIPLFSVSIAYFFIETFIALIFMILSAFKVHVPLVVVIVLQVLFLGIFAIAVIVALLTQSHVRDIEHTIKTNVQNIRGLVTELEMASQMIQDENMKKRLSSLAEEVRYSDPTGNESTVELDTKLKSVVADIKNAAVSGNIQALDVLVNQGKLTLMERNKVLFNTK